MKNIKTLLLSIIVFVSPLDANAFDVVEDPALIAGQVEQLAHDMESIANEATMIQNQITQYENMVQNTIAPVAYIWDTVQQKMNTIRNLSSSIDYYKSRYLDINTYLSKFKDMSYYRSSPCFKFGRCSQQELKELHDSMAFGSDVQNHSNDDFIRYLDQQQNAINDDADTLARLQRQASSADGQMKALQAANQLASAQANQLLQLRTGFNSFANAVIERQQALQNIEAMQEAAAASEREDKLVIGKHNCSYSFGSTEAKCN